LYSGWDHEHYGPREVKPTAIGLATVRRDGYVSLRADGDGEVITRPVIPGGSTVHINADARDGEIRVGMLDEQGDPIRGYGIEACAPLTGDVLDGEVTWGRDPEEGTRTGKPRALQISMRAADLYSLWVD